MLLSILKGFHAFSKSSKIVTHHGEQICYLNPRLYSLCMYFFGDVSLFVTFLLLIYSVISLHIIQNTCFNFECETLNFSHFQLSFNKSWNFLMICNFLPKVVESMSRRSDLTKNKFHKFKMEFFLVTCDRVRFVIGKTKLKSLKRVSLFQIINTL